MKPILLSLNLIILWFGTTAYAGVLWALHFFWFPTWRTLRVENYYDQFIPQTTAATRFFTVVVSLMFLSLIIVIVHEWSTRLKWAALAAFLTSGAATFFGIVGMFMLLFGGLLWHALTQDSRSQALPVLWASLQKFGASIAVALGIAHAIFQSPLAWLVAGFDFLSGVLALTWWFRIRAEK